MRCTAIAMRGEPPDVAPAHTHCDAILPRRELRPSFKVVGLDSKTVRRYFIRRSMGGDARM